jgi:hypothetical protein
MSDDVNPSLTYEYDRSPCGILKLIIDYTPKGTKIKRIRPDMIWNDGMQEKKKACDGFMQYITWDWSEDDLGKRRLIEHFDRFKKAGMGFNCGYWTERGGRILKHCLDCFLDGVERSIPDGKDPVEAVVAESKEST